MPYRRKHHAPTALCVVALILGCGDDATEPQTGSLEASLDMTGVAPDADGCLLSVDDGDAQVLLDGESHVFGDLATGTHTVAISGVAFNCFVQGESSRSVSVTANETTPVPFAVDCPAPGSIEVATATAGTAIDSDGYTVVLDAMTTRSIGVSDIETFDNLPVGEHDIELTGVAGNCSVTGENPRTVAVVENDAIRVDFGIACPPFYDHIAFYSYREAPDGNAEVYVIQPDGSNLLNLTNHEDTDTRPAWSPDGNRMAFQSSRGGSSDIWVMDADGSNPVNLTEEGPGMEAEPAWSPDGSRIAYFVPHGEDDIYVMDADGSNPVNITNHEAMDHAPAWSPNGGVIAFYSGRSGDGDIYLMGEDGSNPVNITNHPGKDTEPAWSPDGNRIAFRSSRDDDQEIYVMDADGSNQVRLTDHPGVDSFPTWSPDGSRIAFVSKRDGNLDIWVMDADGSNLVNITNHLAHDYAPAWSPGQ